MDHKLAEIIGSPGRWLHMRRMQLVMTLLLALIQIEVARHLC
jgi:hypothetical protein